MNSPSHLVQILLPKETGDGDPIAQEWFDGLLQELTDKFGGATSYVRAPGHGLWRNGSDIERDNIAVIEVMAKTLDESFWASLRKRLERELSQKEIVIRSHEIVVL
jgi:hypothetical protein